MARNTYLRGAWWIGASALSIAPGCYTGWNGDRDDEGEASGGADDGLDDAGSDGADSDGGEPACRTAGTVPARLLTREQYDRTVQDLLHTDLAPARDFLPDGTIGSFDNNAEVASTLGAVEGYMRAAEELSTAVDLALVLPCDAAAPADEALCAAEFVADFGGRAYRRPLADAETERLLALYQATRDDEAIAADFDGAIRMVIRAILQSPFFLHHVEIGDATRPDVDGSVPLTGHEIAAQLSYTLWSTMPDDELRAAAIAGELDDIAGIESHARRLLADPRAQPVLMRFFRQWLRLEAIEDAPKDGVIFPEFDQELRASMRAESTTFIEDLLWGDGDGSLTTLLTADYTFVDARLAALYGIDGDFGEDFERVPTVDTRSGLLGHASLLAALAGTDQSSTVRRGLFVREQLMCDPVPPPPPGVDPTPPPAMPGETPPELVERHLSEPTCAACHVLLDPIGLGFEHFDALGRYRTEYTPEKPVDARGEIILNSIPDPALGGPFDGLHELAAKLADSELVPGCAATQALTFGIGRDADLECIDDDVQAAFVASGGDLRELLVHVVTSHAFRYRAPAEPGDEEVCP